MGFQPYRLSFRTSGPVGGDIDLFPSLTEFSNLQRSKIVLLIHGFNNTPDEADGAYSRFFKSQGGIAECTETEEFAPDREFVMVYWKGDVGNVLSAAYYPDAVPNARETAKGLGSALAGIARLLPKPLEVQVVAHSLGTRLAFELLKYVQGNPHLRVSQIVDYAAATPIFMLDDPRDSNGLRHAFEAAGLDGALSLYSQDDRVLHFAFPPGQTLAPGHEGFFPTALGREEWSPSHFLARLSQRQNKNAGHSDYWGSDDHPDCIAFASRQVHEFLGFPRPGSRAVASIPTSFRETPAQTVGVRSTDDRSVAVRNA